MLIAELFEGEHELFRALLDRLELELKQPAESAQRNVREALRFLIPSLDRHAEIEDIVFLHPPDNFMDSAQALAEVEAQHRHLAALRAAVLSTLEQPPRERGAQQMRALIDELVLLLRHHLRTEEEQLWPLYRSALMRPLDSVIPLPIGNRAAALEKALALGLTALSHASEKDVDSG